MLYNNGIPIWPLCFLDGVFDAVKDSSIFNIKYKLAESAIGQLITNSACKLSKYYLLT